MADVNYSLPNLTAKTLPGKVDQIQAYLFGLVEQLQYAADLASDPAGATGSGAVVVGNPDSQKTEVPSQADALASFNAIKGFIIKSADIVNSYYEQIDKLIELNGKYVAQAEFGNGGVAQYIEDTKLSISATTEYVNQEFYKKGVIDAISGKVDGVANAVYEQSGYIRSGNVGSYADPDAIGVEIGEFDRVNGTANRRYARYTSYGLELYGDDMDRPVAYVYQKKLYIAEAEITGRLKIGGYLVDSRDGLTFKWVGR